jgi:hypothetical protein
MFKKKKKKENHSHPYFFSEWLTNINRDSLASFAGHNSLLSYMSVAENECKARVKHNLIEVYQQCFVAPSFLSTNIYIHNPLENASTLWASSRKRRTVGWTGNKSLYLDDLGRQIAIKKTFYKKTHQFPWLRICCMVTKF